MTRRTLAATAAVTVGAAAAIAAAATVVSALPLTVRPPAGVVRQQTETDAGVVPLATPTSAPPPPPSVGANTIFPLAVTTPDAPDGNYTVFVDECIRVLSAAATGTNPEDWSLTTLGDGAALTAGLTRYATRYTAALPRSAAGEPDVALQYARYVGRGGLNQDMDEEPACDGTDFTVRLQTAAAAGVEPTGASSSIPPGTDATEASAVGSIVVAGPGGLPPAVATATPVAPVPAPETTPPPPVATPEPTQAPVDPPTVAPVPVPVPGDETDSDEELEGETEEPTEEATEEPVVVGAGEVEAAAGESDDDGGSNLVPIIIGCALGIAALGLAAFAILTHIRTGEAPRAAVARTPPPPPPAPAAPPAPAVMVPPEPAVAVPAVPAVPVAETAGLAAAGAVAGAAGVAAAPLVVASPATNTHDYQIGEGPVMASSPPPPPGFLIPAETTAIGGVGGGAADAGIAGVEGLAVEGATAPVATTAPVVEGAEGAAQSVLPVVGTVGATGAAAAALPFVVPPGGKESGSSTSSLDGGPPAPPVAGEKQYSYDTVGNGSGASPPPPPPPLPPPPMPPMPIVSATDYELPPEAPDFPAADAYGAGVEEPASFGGKMMTGLTGGLAGTGRDTTAGTYEVGTGVPGAVAEDARDMGMPVLDSPTYSELRGDVYGRR